VPAKPSGPTKPRLRLEPDKMAEDNAPNSLPNKRLDLSEFLYVPRKASVKASAALSSMGPPPSRLQARTRKQKDEGAEQQQTSEDDIITVAAKHTKRAEDTSITKANKEKRVPQPSPFTSPSSSLLNQDPQHTSPSITASSVRNSRSGNASSRRRISTCRQPSPIPIYPEKQNVRSKCQR